MQFIYLLSIAPLALATTFVESQTHTKTITSCAPGVTDCPVAPVQNNTEPVSPSPAGNQTEPPVSTFVGQAGIINVGAGMALAAGLGALLI